MENFKFVYDYEGSSLEGRVFRFLDEVFDHKFNDSETDWTLKECAGGFALYADGYIECNTIELLSEIVAYGKNKGKSCDFYLTAAFICQENTEVLDIIIGSIEN